MSQRTLDLVVDVGVLMSASGLGAPEHHRASLEMAGCIESRAECVLALDKRGRIQHQYEEKMKPGTLGHELVARLAKSNRIAFVPWKGLDRGVRTALREEHFDPEDYKYVETAAATASRILVSHDPDYSRGVRKALRKVSVRILSADETSRQLRC